MVLAMLRRLLIAITIFAFVGGMTLQAMPPSIASDKSAPLSIAKDCARMALPHDMGRSHAVPCKGVDPECVKQNGCLGTASLPLRPPGPPILFTYGRVAYWAPPAIFAGRSVKPDLYPPIGL